MVKTSTSLFESNCFAKKYRKLIEEIRLLIKRLKGDDESSIISDENEDNTNSSLVIQFDEQIDENEKKLSESLKLKEYIKNLNSTYNEIIQKVDVFTSSNFHQNSSKLDE